MKKALLVLSTLLFLVSCTHDRANVKNVNDQPIPVKILQLQADSGLQTVSASGQFTTDDEVYLSFKTGGVIDRIYVKEGDALHKGQLLAVLKLTEIEAQVQQAALAYEKAQRDYKRTANLYADSVSTLEQVQNSKTMMELAKQQLEAARFNRRYSEIRASQNGYVLRKFANEGQNVAPGTGIFQTNGANSKSWLLRVNVNDKQWASVNTNDKAVVYTDAGSTTRYEGIIVRKSQAVDAATGTLTVDIQLTDKKTPGIASGMFGKCVINCTAFKEITTSKTWTISYEALLDADGSMGYVFVVNDNNTVSKAKVSIQSIDNTRVIVSDGLQGVKAIVTTGNAYLADKSSIQIVK